MKPIYKIDKIGLEIECEVSSLIKNNFVSNYGIAKGDGSIYCCPDDNKKDYDEKLKCPFTYQDIEGGDVLTNPDTKLIELVTRPISVNMAGKPRRQFFEMFEMLQLAYKKNEFHYNNTTGLHMHISFKPNKKPSILWSKKFYEFMCEYWRANFPTMYKKRKNNSYCAVQDSEPAMVDDDRYNALNFVGAYERHKTLEIRIFDTCEPKKMRAYALGTIKAIQSYLANPANYKLEPSRVTLKEPKVIIENKTEVIKIIKNNLNIMPIRDYPMDLLEWIDAGNGLDYSHFSDVKRAYEAYLCAVFGYNSSQANTYNIKGVSWSGAEEFWVKKKMGVKVLLEEYQGYRDIVNSQLEEYRSRFA